MSGFLFSKADFLVTPIRSDDSNILHEIHKASFFHDWDETTFVSFLADTQVFGFALRPVGKPGKVLGFILCRLVIDEAEIITIAVRPHYRKRGIGQKLLDAVFRHLYHERAKMLFLEVDESNNAAIKLYKNFGFNEVGRRPSYYQTENGHSDALIMRRTFKHKD